jgi:hypothetical protein
MLKEPLIYSLMAEYHEFLRALSLWHSRIQFL